MASYWDPIRKMLGCPDDAAAAGDGTVIAILKHIRSQLAGVLVFTGAVTVADGADVTQGAMSDPEVAGAGPASVVAILKRIRTLLSGVLSVSGTFWQATQPVSVADGSDVAEGTTIDPAASSTVAEDTTARTGIGLWKGIKNILVLMNAKWAALGQAAMNASMPVVIANDQSALTFDREQGTVAAVIANGANVSGEIDFRPYSMMVIHLPAAWTAASIGFQVSTASAGTFLPLYDENGNLIQLNVTISRAYAVPAGLAGARYVKLWSQNGAGVNQNQGAERTINLDLKV